MAEATLVGRRYFRYPGEALTLAAALRDRGEVAEALAMGDLARDLQAAQKDREARIYGRDRRRDP